MSSDERRQKLRRLERRGAQLKAKMKTVRARISALQPVHQMPTEILAIIFEMAYAHDFPHCRGYKGKLVQSPLTLMHVCRSWRRLAESLPSLWCCIHVSSNAKDMRSTLKIDILKTFIKRSQQHLLSVSFCYKYPGSIDCPEDDKSDVEDSDYGENDWEEWWDYEDYEWPNLEACLNILLRERQRWRHLTVYSNFSEAVWKIQAALSTSGAFPVLEYLQFSSNEEYSLAENGADDESDLRTVDFTLDAPAVTCFRAHAIQTVIPCQSYAHLAELKLDFLFVRADAFWAVLMHVRLTLRRLILHAVRIRRHTTVPVEAIQALSRLEYLVLSELQVPSAGQSGVFSLLLQCSPSLTTFICLDMAIDDIRHLFRTPLLRAAVRTLVLLPDENDPEGDAPALSRDLIRAFPAVENMSLATVQMIGECLRILQGEGGSPSESGESDLWPQLRELTLPTAWGCANALTQVLPSFLAHRARTGHPIAQLNIIDVRLTQRKPGSQLSSAISASPAPQPAVKWLDIDPYASRLHFARGYRDSDPSNFRVYEAYTSTPAYLPWNGSMDFVDQFNVYEG